jgi:hypothetical protein
VLGIPKSCKKWLAAEIMRLRLYCSEFGLLQFNTEHRQMLGVPMTCGRFLAVFHITENWLYSVERIAAGETVDSKRRR